MIKDREDIYRVLENHCLIQNFTSSDGMSPHRIRNHIAETFVKLGLAVVVVEDYNELQNNKNIALRERLEKIEDKRTLMQEKYDKIKEDRDKLKTQKEKVNNQKKKLKAKIEKLEKEKKQLQEDNVKLLENSTWTNNKKKK